MYIHKGFHWSRLCPFSLVLPSWWHRGKWLTAKYDRLEATFFASGKSHDCATTKERLRGSCGIWLFSSCPSPITFISSHWLSSNLPWKCWIPLDSSCACLKISAKRTFALWLESCPFPWNSWFRFAVPCSTSVFHSAINSMGKADCLQFLLFVCLF